MKSNYTVILAGLFMGVVIAAVPFAAPAGHAATAQKPAAISEEASTALMHMGQTLRAEDFAFQVRTIRVYADANGQPLHIFHMVKVVVHRPNRLLVDISGDDGDSKLVFDGKTAIVYSVTQNKYATIPVPEGTIEAMLKEVVGPPGSTSPLPIF